MSTVFSTVFDDDFASFTFHDSDSVAVDGSGCDDGFAYTCCLAQETKVLTAPGPAFTYKNVTLRWQHAIHVVGAIGTGFDDEIVTLVDNETLVSSGFNITINILIDGRVDVYIGISGHNFSAAGAFPVDGTVHGLQLTLAMSGDNHVAFELFLDNVSIVSGVDSTVNPRGVDWGVSRLVVRANKYTASELIYSMSGTMAVEVDDAVLVTDYPACDAATLAVAACFGPLPPVISDMVIDCDTNIITITGTGFEDGAAVTLEDPNGAALPFTLLTFSSTEITLSINYQLAGTYCVTVTNP